jgi:hypothetical protein
MGSKRAQYRHPRPRKNWFAILLPAVSVVAIALIVAAFPGVFSPKPVATATPALVCRGDVVVGEGNRFIMTTQDYDLDLSVVKIEGNRAELADGVVLEVTGLYQ